MASWIRGQISEIVETLDDVIKTKVGTPEGAIDALAFPSMLPSVNVGDTVVVNTTGLDLGTGGVGFILWNLDADSLPEPGLGHIVKMRYTPWQTDVDAVESQESPHHDDLEYALHLYKTPVIACGLHSQVAGVAAGIRAADPNARIGYLMTDGAALPLAWSDLVRNLKQAGLIDTTATYGHAFGGELETVNVFSGLVALHIVAKADYIIAAMGPGVVGTGTALGFTGIEQGQLLDAAGSLGGLPIASLRISFADERKRHMGVSHHSLTALTIGTNRRAYVALPKLRHERAQLVTGQLERSGVSDTHDVKVAQGLPGVEVLRARGVAATSMGRGIEDDLDFWLACAAAGDLAVSLAAE
jgi:hypothetical protein